MELDGQVVDDVRTIRSTHESDSVNVLVDGLTYRITTKELHRMINEFKFKTEKKIKHTYLIVTHKFTDDTGEWFDMESG